MLRSSFTRSAIRRYATADPKVPQQQPKRTSDAFLQNLLDKVKTIREEPNSTFVKKNSMDRGGQPRSNNNGYNNNNRRNLDGSDVKTWNGKEVKPFTRYDNNNNNNNRNNNGFRGGNDRRNNDFRGGNDRRNNNVRTDNDRRNNNFRAGNDRRNTNTNNGSRVEQAVPQQQFSKDEHLQQRRARVEKKFGSSNGTDVFDSSKNRRFNRNNRSSGSPATSIFTAKSGARLSPMKRTRNFQKRTEQTIENRETVEEKYTPQKPKLPDLIKYSSNLAFSSEARMTRAMFQYLQGTYQVPDLYSDKVDLLDHGFHTIVQQPLTPYPYNEKMPLSKSKIMGPTIVNADFDLELLNKTIEKTVFGKFEELKINISDDKLKLNAQVVQNSLNRNIFFNYGDRKEKIYKSCAGLDTVQSLTQ